MVPARGCLMNKKLLLTTTICCVFSLQAIAQSSELRPLAEYLQLPRDRKEEAYPFIRCVGLFRGVFRYGGSNFSEEEVSQTKATNAAMALVAYRYRTNKNPTISENDVVSQIGFEIENIEREYSNRMDRNFTLTGEAWGSDETISSDLEICGEIARIAVSAVNQ